MRSNKLIARLLAAALVVSAVAACSDGPDSGGGVEGAGTQTIGVLTTTDQAEFNINQIATTTKAIEDLGWEVKQIDGKGDPGVWISAMQGFITEEVAGIITIGGIDAAPIKQQLAAAEEAGIPVIAIGTPVDPAGEDDYAAVYSPPIEEEAQVMADFLIETYPSGTEFTSLDLTAVYTTRAYVEAVRSKLIDAGFVESGTYDIKLADYANDLTAGTNNLYRAHPDAEFMLTCCDGAGVASSVVLEADDATVDVIGRKANPSLLKAIGDGNGVVTVADNGDVGGIVAVDQIARFAIEGSEIDRHAGDGLWEFAIIDQANVPADGAQVFTPDDLLAEYLEKWQKSFGAS